MFEEQTERIINSYNESIKLIKKLENIVKPYERGGAKEDQIFYNAKPRIYSLSSLEWDAHSAIANIVKRHYISRVPEKLRYKYAKDWEKISVKEHIKAINAITPEIFYYNAFYTDVYNTLYGYSNKESRILFKNDSFEDKRAGNYGMFLILDCIYLLDNPEPLTEEQERAINAALRNNNTFVFNGCKITLYNNGRLIIKFSDSELFKRFKKKANEAIKLLNNDLKKEA